MSSHSGAGFELVRAALPADRDSSRAIELSAIIPTYNRAAQLRTCLEALASQTQPGSTFEAVVVIDGSRDGTREMLERVTVPFDLTVLWQRNQGQHVARNRGADVARGRYLLFLDDDLVAAPTLVAEHLRVQRSRERVVAIGRMAMSLPSSADWFAHRFCEAWRRHYEALDRNEKEPSWMDCYGGNLSLERRTFLAVGGFAEGVKRSHDIELGYRLMQEDASFVYVPGAAGHLNESKGVRQLARDFGAAGAAYVQLMHRHPSMLPVLLGPLAEASFRERLLRRAIHRFRLPPRLLGWVGALLRGSRWSRQWFRFLHNYFYWCGVRQAVRDRETWRRLMHGTPILAYHAFAEGTSGSRFVMPVHRFARQMSWVRRLGYRVIGLQEFLRELRDHRLPPSRSVVITIDDGYAGSLDRALSVLHRYGYPATLFVVTDRVGGTNAWSNDDGLRGRRLLTWGEILRMAGNGIEFGAHTETHPHLPALPPDSVRQEVTGSKSDLERRLRLPVRSFAYPYGERDPFVEQVVEQSGFWGSCGLQAGLNTVGTPTFNLRRVEIEGTLSLVRFLLALRTGDTRVRLR